MNKNILFLLFCFCSFFQVLAQPVVELHPLLPLHNGDELIIRAKFSQHMNNVDEDTFTFTNATATKIDSISSIEYISGFDYRSIINGQIVGPTSVDIDCNGNVYVANPLLNSIQIFSGTGVYINEIGLVESMEDSFNPYGIQIVNDTIYVADFDNQRVMAFDLSLNLILSINTEFRPVDISTSHEYIFVAFRNHTIRVFDKSGSFIKDIISVTGQNTVSMSYWNDRISTIGYVRRDGKFDASDSYRFEVFTFDLEGNIIYNQEIGNDLVSSFSPLTAGLQYAADGSLYLIYRKDLRILNLTGHRLASETLDEIRYGSSISFDCDGTTYFSDQKGSAVASYSYHKEYQISGLPVLNEEVLVNVPENTIYNFINEGNFASNVLTIEYDGIKPVPVVSTPLGSPTVDLPLIFNIEFDEIVSELGIEDLSFTGNILQANLSGSGLIYQVEVFPRTNGDITLFIPDSVSTDLAGNFNEASNVLSIDYQSDRPEAELIFPEEFSTDTIVSIEVVFSESVTGLTNGSFQVDDVTILNEFVSTEVYQSFTLDIVPDRSFQFLTISLKDSSALSLDGFPAFPSNELEFYHDINKPLIQILGDTITNQNEIELIVRVTENLRSDDILSEADIVIEGATLMNFNSPSSFVNQGELGRSRDYFLTLQIMNSDVRLLIPSGVLHDFVGNESLEVEHIITVDKERPLVDLEPRNEVNTEKIFIVDLDVNEDTDINQFDVSISGGQIESFLQVGNSYELMIEGSDEEGVVALWILDNRFTDFIGNGNTPSDTLVVLYDTTPFDVEIVSETAFIISDETIDEVVVDIVFSEPIVDFSLEELIVNGGNLSSSSSNEDSTSFRVVLDLFKTPEQIVELIMPNNIFKNRYGITNPSGEISFLVDKTAPNVEWLFTGDSNVNGLVEVEFYFDDPVFDFLVDPIGCLAFDSECFTEDDILIEGGEIKNFTRVLDTYKFDLIPIEREISITIPPNVAFNIGDLGNLQSTTLELFYENGEVVVGLPSTKISSDISYWFESSKTLTIDLFENIEDPEIRVIDINGKTVLRADLTNNVNTVDLNKISNGVYILLILKNSELLLNSKFLLND